MCANQDRVRIRLPRGEWFYEPQRRLGPPGGFGEVFEGQDASGQAVAVKRLSLTVGDAAHRELKIADELAGKVLQHSLAVFDSGEDSEGGGYFVVMPRAEGSLADELKKRGMFNEKEATEILGQIAEGLKEVEFLVHRDLKPGNILFHDGRWKIADFGIARFVEDATSSKTVRDFLSAQYAAPEQWLGEHATHATDVYALSCIAYVLLRGEPPFLGPTQADFQRQHTLQTPPPLTGVDSRLRAIFSAGLRKPQTGRPPIDRVISVLRDAASSPSSSSPGMAALQAANAAEAERVSAAAAQAEGERRRAVERTALVHTGDEVLRHIIERMKHLVTTNVSEAKIRASLPSSLHVVMGPAEMVVVLDGATPPDTSFHSAKWSVASMGRIQVRQGAPLEWNHGATLWYMERQPQSGYRWYEVSYRRHALASGPIIGPFAIQNIGNDIFRNADLAAGPGMHVIEVESGPTPIDDENVDTFLDRWLARLAQAYEGRLRPF